MSVAIMLYCAAPGRAGMRRPKMATLFFPAGECKESSLIVQMEGASGFVDVYKLEPNSCLTMNRSVALFVRSCCMVGETESCSEKADEDGDRQFDEEPTTEECVATHVLGDGNGLG